MSIAAPHARAADPAALETNLGGPAWLAGVRRTARERFLAMGWPTTQEEEWRRTSLRTFDFDAYPYEAAPPASIAAAGLPDGVFAGSLLDANAPSAVVESARAALERSVAESDNRIQLWHYALLDEITVVHFGRGVRPDGPIVVAWEFEGREAAVAPHLVVVLEEGAQASVVKVLRSPGEGELLVLDADELILGPAASLRHLTLQSLGGESLFFGNGRGDVGRDARLHRTEAALGAAFVKARFVSEITGAGAEAKLNGIYFASGDQHMDLRTVQQHRAPHSASRAYYRGAVRDESHSVYQGLIQVTPEARATDAYLTNKNLILNDGARADSIPSLNISTDEVKCSHGSTTGQLDPRQMFYLKARGYSCSEARRTLIEGYFEDLVSQVPEEWREEIRSRIDERITGET